MSMSNSTSSAQSHPSDEEFRMVYQQLCTSYQNIQDFRAKLLGLLPFVTASSFVATIISDPAKQPALLNLVLPFGLLGAIVTLGLFFYEIENLQRATLLTVQGRELERSMNIIGSFALHSPYLFNAHNAAGLIYSTTFAGWICLALWFMLPGIAIYVTLLIFAISLLLSLPVLKQVRTRVLNNVQAWGTSGVSFHQQR